jgi:hypothetical protein
MMTEYIPYIISQRIKAFRRGLYPTTKKVILKEISEPWINFFNKSKISNIDFREVMNDYKNNKYAFLYLDPPYMDSFNGGYNCYNNKNYNEDLSVKDNTEMYIFLLEYLKVCKCKVLFSINDNALTKYLYKDFIKDTYNHKYQTTHLNIKDLKLNEDKKQVAKKYKCFNYIKFLKPYPLPLQIININY